MSYHELRERQQKDVDNFPFIFAFNQKQFQEGCDRFGITDPAEELYSIGGGGFIRKTDSEKLDSLMESLSNEMSEALKDDDFLLDALQYELDNHEYVVSNDLEPALNALGLSLEEVRQSERLSKALKITIGRSV